MFEQTILAGAGRTRRAWTVPVCFAGQLAAVACMALAPLVFFEGLPQGQLAAPRLTVPRVYHPPVEQHVQLVATGAESTGHPFVQPARIHHGIDLGPDRPFSPPDPAPACTGLCVPDSAGPSNALDARVILPLPPEDHAIRVITPTARPTPTPAPIRMSEGVQEAMLIHRVTPVYPLTAIKTRVSGVVRLAAVIGADGRIRELQVLGGHPFLVQAAVNAVREWVYRPTMLNGSPVEVMTDITVTFNLR